MTNKKSRLSIFVSGSFLLHAAIAAVALTSELKPKEDRSLLAVPTEIEMATVTNSDANLSLQAASSSAPSVALEVKEPEIIEVAPAPEVVEKPKLANPEKKIAKVNIKEKVEKPSVLPLSKNKSVEEKPLLDETKSELLEPVVTLVPEKSLPQVPSEESLEEVSDESINETADAKLAEPVEAKTKEQAEVETEKDQMIEAAKAWKGEEEAAPEATVESLPASSVSTVETAPASEVEAAAASVGEPKEGMATPSAGLIKSIEQFKQKPGNKTPKYDANERRLGHQGEVTFLAYVSASGGLSNFKIIQSTGYRNLDLKSLGAIKTWKFQAGQEGWVEIPLKWRLEGGPQIAPSTLRRKISKN